MKLNNQNKAWLRKHLEEELKINETFCGLSKFSEAMINQILEALLDE